MGTTQVKFNLDDDLDNDDIYIQDNKDHFDQIFVHKLQYIYYYALVLHSSFFELVGTALYDYLWIKDLPLQRSRLCSGSPVHSSSSDRGLGQRQLHET